MAGIIRKNYGVWIALAAVFTAVVLAVFVFSLVALVRSVSQPRIPIENGGLVTKYASGTFRIFLEDNMPPTLNSHPFTFTNTANQARITSQPPTRVITYSINSLIVNNEVRRGTFGRLVATVELEAGTYIVEFPRWDGPGIFVWAGGMPGALVILRLAASGLALNVLIVGLIIFIHDQREQKKRALEAAALTSNMQLNL